MCTIVLSPLISLALPKSQIDNRHPTFDKNVIWQQKRLFLRVILLTISDLPTTVFNFQLSIKGNKLINCPQLMREGLLILAVILLLPIWLAQCIVNNWKTFKFFAATQVAPCDSYIDLQRVLTSLLLPSYSKYGNASFTDSIFSLLHEGLQHNDELLTQNKQLDFSYLNTFLN